MSDITAADMPPAPLVALTEDETMFRDTVRQFADEAVRPHVKEMDEKGVFEPSLIQKFFELGLMGIEVPVEYGGGGGTFFLQADANTTSANTSKSAAILDTYSLLSFILSSLLFCYNAQATRTIY